MSIIGEGWLSSITSNLSIFKYQSDVHLWIMSLLVSVLQNISSVIVQSVWWNRISFYGFLAAPSLESFCHKIVLK